MFGVWIRFLVENATVKFCGPVVGVTVGCLVGIENGSLELQEMPTTANREIAAVAKRYLARIGALRF